MQGTQRGDLHIAIEPKCHFYRVLLFDMSLS